MKSSNLESNENLDATKHTKKCTKCGEVKNLSEYHKDAKGKDSLRSYCKVCEFKNRVNYLKSLDPIEYKKNTIYHSAKARAKKKGIEFTLTKDDIVIPDVCPCLGVPILIKSYENTGTVGTVGPCQYSPSLDRIDNNKGYTPDNIWIVSHLANSIMASTNDPEQIILTGKRFKAKLLSIEREKQLELDL